MLQQPYILKVSSQSQITLPKTLREHMHIKPGARIALRVDSAGALRISSTLPIERRFGTLAGSWTQPGQDAAAYTRELRDALQPESDHAV